MKDKKELLEQTIKEDLEKEAQEILKALETLSLIHIYYGFTSGGVANFAHIGGLLSGFILSVLLYWKRQRKYSGYAGN